MTFCSFEEMTFHPRYPVPFAYPNGRPCLTDGTPPKVLHRTNGRGGLSRSCRHYSGVRISRGHSLKAVLNVLRNVYFPAKAFWIRFHSYQSQSPEPPTSMTDAEHTKTHYYHLTFSFFSQFFEERVMKILILIISLSLSTDVIYFRA